MITMKDLKQIRSDLQRDFNGLSLYDFQDEHEEPVDQINSKLPLCIINSEELSSDDKIRVMGVMQEGKKILAREYLWGLVNVQNKSSCDFELLKEILFVENLDDLRSYTRNYLYEGWRTEMLASHKKSMLPLPGDLKIKMVLDGLNEDEPLEE